MTFLEIRIPKENSYTTEQMETLLSNLIKSNKGGLFSKPQTTVSLNIISQQQKINFFLGIPQEKVNFTQSQVLAQYPDAIINPSKNPLLSLPKIDKALFCRLVLTNSYYYPLKTAENFTDTDPLSSILATLAKIKDPKAWAGYQLIIAGDAKGAIKKINSKILTGIKDEDGNHHPHPDQSLFERKITKNLLTASVNLIASDESILNELVGSFGVFADPKGNNLTDKKPNLLNKKRIYQSIINHQPDHKTILNLAETAALWHLPTEKISLPNIAWGRIITTEAPDDLPVTQNLTEEEKEHVCFFARTEYKNRIANFGIKKADRRLHFYTIGKTGTGKSTLIANMAISDIRKGRGVAVIDPHGDLIDILLNYIPSHRINDVCYFNPADKDYTYPLNPLEITNKEQKELVASSILAIFHKLYSYSWGPRLEHIFRNTLLTLVEIPNTTLVNVVDILTKKDYRNNIIKSLNNPSLVSFWQNEYEKMPERLQQEAISPILNKVGQFVSSPSIREIIRWPQSKINLEEIMNEGKILLADLSQGKLGEDNSALLGAMLITQIQLAAMNRVNIPEESRRDFYLFVDEFQNFATTSFIKILSEARKYRLCLILTNQYMAQLDEGVQSAIFGNIGSLASFIIGNQDAQILAREVADEYDENDLISLDRFQILTKLAINGRTSKPFLAYTLPLPSCTNQGKDKVIKVSQQRFGKKK
ncbi:MAG: type IV secretion system DNA-binding domain-containing protein [Candidatus Shapirobacteria bacterium]|nr:type IV secretion system DNA-binding domain-containing protein [Candidatus Shapirobacteria bacterium]